MKRIYKLILLFLICFEMRSVAQSNNPGAYCQPQFSQSPCNQPGPSNNANNYINDFINSFSTSGAVVNIANNNTGCCGMPNNYIYYCNKYLVVTPSAVINCTVQSGTVWAQGFSIFIDWNQDNIFNLPSERVAYTAGIPPPGSNVPLTFTVPAGQANGLYRLRVRCYWINGISIDPCAMAPYGETEDYNVLIGISPPAGPGYTVTASNNSPFCPGQTLSLTAVTNATNPAYSWSGPLNYTSNVQNPILPNTTFSMGGTYWVAVAGGTCPVMASTYAWIYQAPSLTVTNSPTLICTGSSATLTASGANNYTWSTGSNSAATVVTPSVTSVYTLSGSNGTCTSTQLVTQSVNPIPALQIMSSSSVLCTGSSATLTGSGATSYSWNPGGAGNPITVNPPNTTTYTLTGANGPCTATLAFTQSVSACTGIHSEKLDNAFSVFPNPFLDKIMIDSQSAAYDLKMQNALCQTLLDKSNCSGPQQIDVNDLPSGMYFITIRENGRSAIYKLIKN